MATLFLDDDPGRAANLMRWQSEEENKNTVWVKDVPEILSVLKDYPTHFTKIMLDHDLGGEIYVDNRRPDCGMEVIRWFENIPYEKKVNFTKTKFIVHTHNTQCGIEMTFRLRQLGLSADYVPFGTDKV